jgi:hypothetical protein
VPELRPDADRRVTQLGRELPIVPFSIASMIRL